MTSAAIREIWTVLKKKDYLAGPRILAASR